jgi:hypothetical protein
VPGPQGPPGPQGDEGDPGPAGPPGTTTWAGIVDKPATFPPTVPIAWTDVSGKPATFPPSAHVHPQSEVTNLVADLALKAPLASPTFTGDPKAPTPAAADNDTSIATTAWARAAVVAASRPMFEAAVGAHPVSVSTWTAVTGMGENIDTDNCFNGNRFIPTVSGWYLVGGALEMPTLGGFHGCAIWKNGAPTNYVQQISAGGTHTAAFTVSAMVFFNGTTDWVELVGITDYSSGPTFNRGSFYAHRVT